MRRYRQKFLNHVILVSQEYNGSWKVEILGPQALVRQYPYSSAEEVKKAAHRLAHNSLERKSDCDCSYPPGWREEDY